MMKHLNKIFVFAVLIIPLYFIPVIPAKADSYVDGWFDILNPPDYGSHIAQYAPSTLNLIFISYSYDNSSDTKVKFDCNSDGTYEIDRTIPASAYSYRWSFAYFTSFGTCDRCWRYNEVGLSSPAFFGIINDGSLSCYYPLPGRYTITMLAERGGVQFNGTRSFDIREPSVSMVARPFYNNFIIEDGYPNSDLERGMGGAGINNIPKVPATIDLGVAIYNSMTYDSGAPWPLFTSSATLKFDCNSDGTYETTESYPRPATTAQKETFCSYYDIWTSGSSRCLQPYGNQLSYYPGVCKYDSPGIYRATIRAELSVSGAPPYIREIGVEYPVAPESPATVNFSTGGDTTAGAAPLKGVDLKLDVANLVWANNFYNFSCGNGQTTSRIVNADFSKRYYNQDYSVLLKDFCNYDVPGEYLAKAQSEFRTVNFPGGLDLIRNTLPSVGAYIIYLNGNYGGGGGPFKLTGIAGGYLTYTADQEVKVLVTGKVAEDEYIVTSPFDLRWDASKVSSCSVAGVGNSFSASGGGAKTVGVSNVPPGDYSYKLTCNSSSGITVDKIIKVKVIAP